MEYTSNSLKKTLICRERVYLFYFVSLLTLFAIGCEQDNTVNSNSEAGTEEGAGLETGGETQGGMSQTTEECQASALGLASDTEVCDEVDNDCDGMVDEGFSQLGMVCERRLMLCRSEGIFACDAEGGVSCNAPMLSQSEEICDELDNDCDGEIDEGFALLVDSENCGQCGVSCSLDNGVGRCDAGQCVVGSCTDGFSDINGDANDGCECNLNQEELCDGIDNDCDGSVDENFAVGSGCTVGEGECVAQGQLQCVSDNQAACDATALMPNAELCDGLDNDCDGKSDEDFDSDNDGAAACDICDSCLLDAEPCPEFCRHNDCADQDAEINPFAWDICNDTIDQNCDGADAPCTEAYARATRLHIVSTTDTLGTCPDQNGDGVGDNAFGQISGIANPSIVNYIATNQMNILVGAYQFDTTRPETRFNLSVLLGSYFRGSSPPRYLIRQSNFSDIGRPLMLFPFTELNQGALEGGPGTFMFNAPFSNGNGETILIEVPIEGAYIRGQFSQDPRFPSQFNLNNGIVSGYINKQTLQESFVLLDPPIVRVIESLITPDLDLNQDGEPDYYSICLLTTLSGVETEIEVPEEPTP